MAKTIRELVLEYFKNHPNKELPHGPVVDWVTEQYEKEHGNPPRDPWRTIRQLHQEGKLKKIRKGVYEYDPSYVHEVVLFEFSPRDREVIFERDGHRCVVCGRGPKDGVELAADHIKPKDKGGTNTIENGQTLCYEHNLRKSNYSQTEAGKRYFIRMYQTALKNQDEKMIAFCQAVFDVYDEHDVDQHIDRPDTKNRLI
ncbi:MAG: HNH endonuclease [Candidatus Poribacteria bacterium]|nr:HNH endonuclease [Candidatus Poribacteria bacterium]MDE0484526.1 HNH endonuclease [Candidatus Poribacteria bacterium]